MISLFDQELTEMEREVRDLKTIYQRGLGTTRFYSKTKSKTFSVFADFTATIENGEPMPALITLAVNLPEPIYFPMMVFTPQTQGMLFDVLGSTPGTAKGKVLSSSQIASVT